jgi:Pyruvate/2-oxoacid:ferredoxin oxidoreductase gamma subunit
MEKTYPLGVLRDRTAEAHPTPAPEPAPALDLVPQILGITGGEAPRLPITCGPDSLHLPGWSNESNAKLRSLLHSAPSTTTMEPVDLRIRVAGFGGQGVLLAGEVLAEAGLDAGLEVSWLPSYGPEMRSGTSNCHIRLSREPIDSPLVTSPNMLLAMNEPSLKKFAGTVQPGGWILYNGEAIPEDCQHDDVRALAFPFTQIADQLGEPRVANMVILGTLLEITGVLPQASLDAALHRLIKHSKWLEIDERALTRGRELYRESKE